MNTLVRAGEVAGMERTLSQTDGDWLAALRGDDNAIHIDPQFVAATKFGQTEGHGMFV